MRAAGRRCGWSAAIASSRPTWSPFLGYTWDTVHDEAERLEHAVSDTLVERMAVALGHPTVDPHGDPIPDADGAIHELGLHAALRASP